MHPPESSLLSSLMALVAMFLALAIVVQIIQEIYKYLTCSKSRAYAQALEDFAGPLASSLVRRGSHPNPGVRGPFQFSRFLPRDYVLPLTRAEFARAIEETSPAWVVKALRALELEERVQDPQTHKPSPAWIAFLDQLAAVEPGGSGAPSAEDVGRFLRAWGHRASTPDVHASLAVGHLLPPRGFDAARVMPAFRAQFLRDGDEMVARFSTLVKNFAYTYRRRNMRQTFIIALVLSLVCNLPLDRLYQKASALSSEEATQLAERTVALFSQLQRDSVIATGNVDLQHLLGKAASTAGTVITTTTVSPPVNYIIDGATVRALWNAGAYTVLRHLLGCLITALLLSFGAPVWNDIVSALLRVQKERRNTRLADIEEATGG